jgi:hypothetical protein
MVHDGFGNNTSSVTDAFAPGLVQGQNNFTFATMPDNNEYFAGGGTRMTGTAGSPVAHR